VFDHHILDRSPRCLELEPQLLLERRRQERNILGDEIHADGTIRGGMALKVQVALAAAAAGVREVVIAGKERLLGTFEGTTLTLEPGRPQREEIRP